MSEATSEFCKWCDGSGVDQEGIALSNPYPCIDCKGSGFEHGEQGKIQYYKELDEKPDDVRQEVWDAMWECIDRYAEALKGLKDSGD